MFAKTKKALVASLTSHHKGESGTEKRSRKEANKQAKKAAKKQKKQKKQAKEQPSKCSAVWSTIYLDASIRR